MAQAGKGGKEQKKRRRTKGERESRKGEQEVSKEGTAKPPLAVVTGACGFIGSHLVEFLKSKGFRVRACDLPSAFQGKDEFEKARYPDVVRKSADEIVECDVTRKETLYDVVRDADYIFHLSAILDYSAPWQKLYEVNVKGTQNLFEVIVELEVPVRRVVVWSTNGIYGVPEKHLLPIREDSHIRPVNRYSLSKFLQELVAWDFHRRYSVPLTVVKPTAVYGPRETHKMLQTLRDLSRQKFIVCPINFTFTVPTVHVEDVVGASVHLAQLPEANGQDYLIDDGSNLTFFEQAKIMAEVLDKPFYALPPVPVSLVRHFLIYYSWIENAVARLLDRKPETEPDFMMYAGADLKTSNQKLLSTGYILKYPDPRIGIKDTVEWFRKNNLLP